MNQFDTRWIQKFQKEEIKKMSHFELQPVTPTVKEIFDTFEEEFFEIIKDESPRDFADLKELFIAAKINTVKKLLSKGVTPME
jgi:hypothetical protein